MSDQGEQKVKHDPAIMMKKIIDFLGEDITKRPKLSRDVLDDILDEFNAESEAKLKEEVKTIFKEIIDDTKKLREAEKTYQHAKEQAGKALNEKLQKLTQKIDKVNQDKADTRAIVSNVANPVTSDPVPASQVDVDMQSDTSTQNIPNLPEDHKE